MSNKTLYRLEDDNGWGVFNKDNCMYNVVNKYSEAEIHRIRSLYSMLDENVKKSLTKPELMIHHCAFEKEEQVYSLNGGVGYNILEIVVSAYLAPRANANVYMFKKENIISSKTIGKTK